MTRESPSRIEFWKIVALHRAVDDSLQGARDVEKRQKRLREFIEKLSARLDTLGQVPREYPTPGAVPQRSHEGLARTTTPVRSGESGPTAKTPLVRRPAEMTSVVPSVRVESELVRRLLEAYNAGLETGKTGAFNSRYSPQSLRIMSSVRVNEKRSDVVLEQSESGVFSLVECEGRLLLFPMFEIPDASYLAEIRDCFDVERQPGVRDDRVILSVERSAECSRAPAGTWVVVMRGRLTLAK
jgi:hypothetical protein